VSGVDAAALRELRRTNWTTGQWASLLVVRTEQGNLFAEIGTPPMLGSYSVEGKALRFTPQFPLERALTYRASFHPEKLPGGRGPAWVITATHELPRGNATPNTVVAQI